MCFLTLSMIRFVSIGQEINGVIEGDWVIQNFFKKLQNSHLLHGSYVLYYT